MVTVLRFSTFGVLGEWNAMFSYVLPTRNFSWTWVGAHDRGYLSRKGLRYLDIRIRLNMAGTLAQRSRALQTFFALL